MNKIIENLKIEKTITLIKDYSSFLLMIVSFLGGTKQFITLCFYSPSLLPYFSLSQVLIDGISILIKSILFLLTFFIGNKSYHNLPPTIRVVSIVITSICLIVFLTLTIIPSYTPIAHVISQNLFLTTAGFLFGLLYHLGDERKNRFAFLVCLYGLFMILSDHRQDDDILNIQTNNTLIKKKYPKAKLLYQNDLYLFYGIPKDASKEIVNIGLLIPPPRESFVVCNFYVEKKDKLFE